jgi:hypothetical protein
MTDPQNLQDQATHVILHAWITRYLAGRASISDGDAAALAKRLHLQAGKLNDSAIALAAALEKMRAANAKLAQRMAEHKAFFAKYRPE